MSDRFEDQSEENATLVARLAPSPLSRRKMLLGGGAGALALAAAACEQNAADKPAATGDPTATTEAGGTGGGGDVATAKLAAGLEVLAVNTYDAALKANLDYPAAVAEFATTAKAHHEAHRDAWNELLTSLGESPVAEPGPAAVATAVNEKFGQVSDVAGVAMLALMLEQAAADTYFGAIPGLANEKALELAATIHPIDMQHAAILRYVLGEYPVPNTFANTENAVTG